MMIRSWQLKWFKVEICLIYKTSSRSSEELDGPAVSALRRANAEVKQRWSVIGWVTKNLLSRASACFGRHVKPLAPASFVVVYIHRPALDPRGGLWPFLLMCIHKEGLFPSSGDINRLMMMMMISNNKELIMPIIHREFIDNIWMLITDIHSL
jgi:hypothetical protein